jgi:AcrR family transcriptional regulator
VIKRIRNRAYRYRVESYRDAQGKARGRWTYLGPAEAPEAEDRGAPAAATRERLLDALERLLERGEYGNVTVSAIALEAGLAHGTLYRYFPNKREALRAAMQRYAESAERIRASFNAPLGTKDEERARLRAWVEQVLRAPIERAGLFRAWFALSVADDEIGRVRRERRAATGEDLRAYLERLRARGYAPVVDALATMHAILALLDGSFRRVIDLGSPLDEADVRGAAELIDRGVFG